VPFALEINYSCRDQHSFFLWVVNRASKPDSLLPGSNLVFGFECRIKERIVIKSCVTSKFHICITDWSLVHLNNCSCPHITVICRNLMNLDILGDPEDDAIFSGERHFWRESLLQGLKSPWALFLTKRVPEIVEILPANWPQFFLWPINEEV